MALERNRYPYELLIRGNPDGRIDAHLQHMTIITDGDEVLKREEEPPVAITPESIAGTPFQDVIGEFMAQTLADNAALDVALADAKRERDEALGQCQMLEREIAKARLSAVDRPLPAEPG